MQTESRMRLLYKNKIAGFFKFQSNSDSCFKFYHADMSPATCDNLTFDSHELGFKYDDKWYFEGDIFEIPNRSEKEYTLYYMIEPNEYEDMPFFWELKGKFDQVDLDWALKQQNAKLIGNIHEG